jgi:hypothetical protein
MISHALTAKEKFVLDITKNKQDGFYLELGGSHSTENSNTYNLETYNNWKGLALEIVPELQEEYSANRKNPCLLEDAMKFNYLDYFENNDVPKQIDFLSVNIDTGYNDNTGRLLGNPAQSLLGLIALPLNSYRFTVITFEHESLQDYKNGSIRDAQREILNALGYSLVVRTWAEDWWVDPAIMPYSEYKNFYKIMSA